jgi:hypothetical protein
MTFGAIKRHSGDAWLSAWATLCTRHGKGKGTMKFSHWDVETNSYLGRFDDEREALVLVRTLVDDYGSSYADRLDLGAITDDGEPQDQISGAALLARVGEILPAVHPDDDERRGGFIASAIMSRKAVASSLEPMAAAPSCGATGSW